LSKRLTVACFMLVVWACTYNARRGTPVEQDPMRVLANELRLGRDEKTAVSKWDEGEDAEIAELPATLLTNYIRPALAVLNSGVGGLTTAAYASNAELEMFELLNNDRTAPAQTAEAGPHVQPLQWNSQLAAFARMHSQELAETGRLSHASANGSQPSVRLSKAGIQWVSMGENIAMDQSVAQAEAALMNEPKFRENHRANILNPAFTNVGVGIARGPDGTLYITQDFVQVR